MKSTERLPLILSYLNNAESILKEIHTELGVRKNTVHGRMAGVALTDLSAALRLIERQYGTDNTGGT